MRRNIILGIETSCDDTAASVIENRRVLSSIVSSQLIHKNYGGVFPEYASRSHYKDIVKIVDVAIHTASISKNEINAIAFTIGPGLIGSLLIGASFAKTFSLILNIPIIGINHIHAHIFSHFIHNQFHIYPKFPFLCLTISGGHSQIVIVKNFFDVKIIGQTLDDSVGELFDKCAKMLGLNYPGGPVIDSLSLKGDCNKFSFNKPNISGLNFSFSGLKSNFMYFLSNNLKLNSNFINIEINNICASLQKTILDILINKLKLAIKTTNIKEVAISGGVSSNLGLRKKLTVLSKKNNWILHLLPKKYTTDNAAMIALLGYIRYKNKLFSSLEIGCFSN